MIKTERILKIKEDGLIINSSIPLNIENEEFNILMSLYKKANDNIIANLSVVKKYFKEIYQYDVINNITYRIKSKNSILNKMKNKHYEITYKNLIENINDIAGIRVICAFKSDIAKVINVILNMPNTKIVKQKDYIAKPKETGYTGYHIILETFVEYKGERIPIKVEIQIRSMAMDFWSTAEHKMCYKPKQKSSRKDYRRMKLYSKIINIIDNKITKIYQKQLATK